MGCQTHANFQLVVVTGSLEEKKRNSVHSLFKNFSIFSIFVDFVLQPTDFLLETRFALPHPSLHDSTQYIELWRDGCSAMSWRGLAVLLNMTATFAYAYGPERQVFHFLGASTIQNGTKVPLFSKRIFPSHCRCTSSRDDNSVWGELFYQTLDFLLYRLIIKNSSHTSVM